MPGIFEIKPVANGHYQFQFVSGKGETLLISGDYENRDQAELAIKDVRVGSLMSQQIAKGKTDAGETFFVIKDPEGKIIAKSLLFDNEMRFDNALHAVRDDACIAEIVVVN